MREHLRGRNACDQHEASNDPARNLAFADPTGGKRAHQRAHEPRDHNRDLRAELVAAQIRRNSEPEFLKLIADDATHGHAAEGVVLERAVDLGRGGDERFVDRGRARVLRGIQVGAAEEVVEEARHGLGDAAPIVGLLAELDLLEREERELLRAWQLEQLVGDDSAQGASTKTVV